MICWLFEYGIVVWWKYNPVFDFGEFCMRYEGVIIIELRKCDEVELDDVLWCVYFVLFARKEWCFDDDEWTFRRWYCQIMAGQKFDWFWVYDYCEMTKDVIILELYWYGIMVVLWWCFIDNDLYRERWWNVLFLRDKSTGTWVNWRWPMVNSPNFEWNRSKLWQL